MSLCAHLMMVAPLNVAASQFRLRHQRRLTSRKTSSRLQLRVAALLAAPSDVDDSQCRRLSLHSVNPHMGRRWKILRHIEVPCCKRSRSLATPSDVGALHRIRRSTQRLMLTRLSMAVQPPLCAALPLSSTYRLSARRVSSPAEWRPCRSCKQCLRRNSRLGQRHGKTWRSRLSTYCFMKATAGVPVLTSDLRRHTRRVVRRALRHAGPRHSTTAASAIEQVPSQEVQRRARPQRCLAMRQCRVTTHGKTR
mmetsp:Transcript_81027/g.156478  ORF Transcript_81027/g.156478 Transcript_81027/m.156478 type:complete len:251 (-) Transcript_81027:319-1071(-)